MMVALGNNNCAVPPSVTVGEKDLKVIQREMRDVIRQITACVTFLPLLDQQCT